MLPRRRASADALMQLQQIAAAKLGLEPRPGKELLLQARTNKHMRELGVSDAAEYMRLVEGDGTGERIQELMDLLTTNHTAFWREPGHFEWLREHLPETCRGGGRITIWCAGAASGEEAYTLAMVAREALGPAAAGRVQILATDVSTRMLRAGRAGIYSRERIRPLPEVWQRQYFTALGGEECQVDAEIRGMVHFRRLNLIEPLPRMGPFPYIFCRNVMIYFSRETRQRVVGELMEHLTPDGHLVVGSAEGLGGLETETDFVRPAIYRLKQEQAAASPEAKAWP